MTPELFFDSMIDSPDEREEEAAGMVTDEPNESTEDFYDKNEGDLTYENAQISHRRRRPHRRRLLPPAGAGTSTGTHVPGCGGAGLGTHGAIQ